MCASRSVPIQSDVAAFAYTAVNATGAEVIGEIHAGDLMSAREELRGRGLLPTALAEQDSSADTASSEIKKVKPKSLQIFSRQFATMIEAGLNVVTALTILEEQTEDRNLEVVISALRSDVGGRASPLGGHVTSPQDLQPPLHFHGPGG